MGYETKLYVGSASKWGSEKKFCMLVDCVMDLCKTGYDGAFYKFIQEVNKRGKEFDVYFYTNGNKRVTKDCYDQQLKIADPKKTLDALIANSKSDDYWRFNWAINMLKDIIKNRPDNLYCVFYGH